MGLFVSLLQHLVEEVLALDLSLVVSDLWLSAVNLLSITQLAFDSDTIACISSITSSLYTKKAHLLRSVASLYIISNSLQSAIRLVALSLFSRPCLLWKILKLSPRSPATPQIASTCLVDQVLKLAIACTTLAWNCHRFEITLFLSAYGIQYRRCCSRNSAADCLSANPFSAYPNRRHRDTS